MSEAQSLAERTRLAAAAVVHALTPGGVRWTVRALALAEDEEQRRNGIVAKNPGAVWSRHVLADAFADLPEDAEPLADLGVPVQQGNRTPERWITTTDAAKILGCSDRNVRARCDRGTLRGRKRGKTWLVASSSLESLGPVPADPEHELLASVPSVSDVTFPALIILRALTPDGVLYLARAVTGAQRLSEIQAEDPGAVLARAVLARAGRVCESEALSVLVAELDGTPEFRKQANLESSRGMGWISTKDAADRMGCGEANVRALARRGSLPGRKHNGAWLIDPHALPARTSTTEESTWRTA